MISGTFHVHSQSWRYFSREKSIAQTLNLGQLAPGFSGDQVTIQVTPPTGTPGSNFSAPKINLPDFTPYLGVNITQVKNNYPPNWLSAIDPANGFFPQSGSWGGWSGVFWSANGAGQNGEDTGQWFLPVSTGGTFLYIGWLDDTDFRETYGSLSSTFTARFSRANPLNTANSFGGIVPPSNYSDGFYDFKGYWNTPGGGWYNFYEGNKAIGAMGNADGQEIATIVAGVPFGTWIGEHVTRVGAVNYLFGFFHGIAFRLGP